MDIVVFTVILAIAAVLLAYGIYRVFIKMAETETIPIFAFALMMMIFAEIMIIITAVLMLMKLGGVV